MKIKENAMSSAAELHAMVQQSGARFDAATEGIAPDMLESKAICGVWSARDVAGHLADWNDELLSAAEVGAGQSDEARPLVEDGEAYNTSHAEARASQSWAQAKADLDASMERASALLSGIEEDQLSSAATFPWGGEGRVGDMIAGAMSHVDEHVVDLEDGLTP
jgi:DinB superfamily